VEDLLYHKVDDTALGLVRFAVDTIYVTQASGSIQRGIDAATAGETVYVGAGTFTERLIINKPLTLRGANANVPFGSRGAETSVQCTGALSGYPMMTVQADNVTINGFELYGPGSNNAITSENNPIGRSNLTFTFNHVHDIGTTRGSGNIYGFHYMLAGDTPSDIAVTDNLFENIGNATALLGHAGAIYFGQSISTGTLDDVLIERNVVQNVAVTGADKNCWGIVIGVGWNSTGTATDLIIRNNAVSGISGGYAAGIALGGNTPGARVSNNTVSDVTSATHPEATAAVLVETNTGAGTSVITANDLSGATCGILNKTAFAVTAVSNWFGSATGPASDLNAGGIGAAVVNVGGGSVDASPWLSSGSHDNDSVLGFQPAADAGVFYLPASLVFTQQPGGAALGEALNPQPIVTVYDEIGQIATQFVGTVTLALEDKPGSGTLDGTKEKNATAGVVVFNDLSIGTDGGAGYTLLASASPLSIESAAFTINNPPPVLAAMSPIFKPAGSSEFTLTVTGSGFVPSSQVTWNGSVRSTTYVSGSELRATIAASDVAAAGTAAVNVSSPTAASNGALTFTITPSAQASEVWVDDDWTGYGVAGGKTWVTTPSGRSRAPSTAWQTAHDSCECRHLHGSGVRAQQGVRPHRRDGAGWFSAAVDRGANCHRPSRKRHGLAHRKPALPCRNGCVAALAQECESRGCCQLRVRRCGTLCGRPRRQRTRL
jgi:nitrous oxidase accessory protein NosD